MITIQTTNNKYEYTSPNKSKHNDLMPVKGFMQNKNGHKQLNSWIKILNKTGADVKIMDRFFRHRELPDSENFSKPGFQLKTA